jgi:hypothetical protein
MENFNIACNKAIKDDTIVINLFEASPCEMKINTATVTSII